MATDKVLDLEVFDVDSSGVCTADGGFVGDTVGVVGGYVSSYASNGAISITDRLAVVSSTATAVSLAVSSVAGQEITVKCINATASNVVLTPASFQDGTTVTFDADDEYCTLISSGAGWFMESTNATVA